MIHQRQSKAYLGTLQVSCKHLANHMEKNDDKYENSNTNHLGKNVSSNLTGVVPRVCSATILNFKKLVRTRHITG